MKPMEARIIRIEAKVFIGMSVEMDLIENKTSLLWSAFMPRRGEINHKLNKELVSLQVYPEGYFITFDPRRTFTKWALAEVSQVETIPEGMVCFELPAGQYAVFDYKGPAGNKEVFQYIFSEWLPNSGLRLDHRPHFEVLGPKYRGDHPDSEEELWIPIKA